MQEITIERAATLKAKPADSSKPVSYTHLTLPTTERV